MLNRRQLCFLIQSSSLNTCDSMSHCGNSQCPKMSGPCGARCYHAFILCWALKCTTRHDKRKSGRPLFKTVLPYGGTCGFEKTLVISTDDAARTVCRLRVRLSSSGCAALAFDRLDTIRPQSPQGLAGRLPEGCRQNICTNFRKRDPPAGRPLQETPIHDHR